MQAGLTSYYEVNTEDTRDNVNYMGDRRLSGQEKDRCAGTTAQAITPT